MEKIIDIPFSLAVNSLSRKKDYKNINTVKHSHHDLFRLCHFFECKMLHYVVNSIPSNYDRCVRVQSAVPPSRSVALCAQAQTSVKRDLFQKPLLPWSSSRKC